MYCISPLICLPLPRYLPLCCSWPYCKPPFLCIMSDPAECLPSPCLREYYLRHFSLPLALSYCVSLSPWRYCTAASHHAIFCLVLAVSTLTLRAPVYSLTLAIIASIGNVLWLISSYWHHVVTYSEAEIRGHKFVVLVVGEKKTWKVIRHALLSGSRACVSRGVRISEASIQFGVRRREMDFSEIFVVISCLWCLMQYFQKLSLLYASVTAERS